LLKLRLAIAGGRYAFNLEQLVCGEEVRESKKLRSDKV